MIDECNFIHKVPDEALSPMLQYNEYDTDVIIDNNQSYEEINKIRNNELNNIDNTIRRVQSNINSNDLQNKLIRNALNPKDNAHNIEIANSVNANLAKLISFNEDGNIKFNETQINELSAANISVVRLKDLHSTFNTIKDILQYNEEEDKKLDDNKQIKNGYTVRYTNIPKLSTVHFNKISNTIGDVANRKLLYPESDDDVLQFGILVAISNDPISAIFHWDLFNTVFKQDIFLQSLRDITLNLNLEYNTLNEMTNIKKVSKATKQAQLSTLATNICNNRYIPPQRKQNKNDKFWIHNGALWTFFNSTLTQSRALHRCIDILMRDSFKYASGKRLLSRSNWSDKSFQISGDKNGAKAKNLKSTSNNLKKAYENRVSENIITVCFKQVINLFKELQAYIIDSNDLNVFCNTLYDTNNVEYNINLLSMYKKSEIAIITADRSTSKFRLDLMNMKRDILSWVTILKHSKDKNAENIIKIALNDLHILNIITCGEIRNPEQRIEQIKSRLATKYCNARYFNKLKRKIEITTDDAKNMEISEAMDILFENEIFNTEDNKKNQIRIKNIKHIISTFEKEDINGVSSNAEFQSAKAYLNNKHN